MTFHYRPVPLHHQGASWTGADVQKLSGMQMGHSDADRAQLHGDFEKVGPGRRRNNVRSCSESSEPTTKAEHGDMRVAYTSAIAREA